MAYCGNCGVNVGSGRFCPNCGTMCIPTAEKPMVRTKSSAAAENKRWKQAFFTMFIIAVIVLVIVFCASASKGLVGRWEAREGYWSSQRMEFRRDGTFSLISTDSRDSTSGRYSVYGNTLKLENESDETVFLTFKLDGDTFILYTTGDNPIFFHRVK